MINLKIWIIFTCTRGVIFPVYFLEEIEQPRIILEKRQSGIDDVISSRL